MALTPPAPNRDLTIGTIIPVWHNFHYIALVPFSWGMWMFASQKCSYFILYYYKWAIYEDCFSIFSSSAILQSQLNFQLIILIFSLLKTWDYYWLSFYREIITLNFLVSPRLITKELKVQCFFTFFWAKKVEKLEEQLFSLEINSDFSN